MPADPDPTLPVSADDAADLGATIGRYRIERVLGRGGMGVVVAAFDPELGRKVAIKVLHESSSPRGGGSIGDRLRREAQALARVTHPNVVAVYDAGVAGAAYLVMQLVEGETVGEHLARAARSPQVVLDLFAQAARGLSAIHDAGLIHRDIKPGNLLIDAAGVVRVSDLGLARIGELTQASSAGAPALPIDAPLTTTVTHGLVGTPAYMAPEQLVGSAVTAASDQFSLCVALWEALFGQRPFVADSPAALHQAIRAGALPEPRAGVVGRSVVAALRRGLAADPAARFPTIAALAAALQPPRRRAWWRVGAAAAGLAGVAVVVVGTRGGATHLGPVLATSGAAGSPVVGPLAIDADTMRRLTLGEVCEEFPAIGPDGTIYYDAPIGADTVLFALPPDGGPARALTQVRGWDLTPAPSPDGRHLAWLRKDDGPMRLVVAELGHLDRPRELDPGGFRPLWSRDGRFVWGGGRGRLRQYDVATGAVAAEVKLDVSFYPIHGLELASGDLVLLTKTGVATADGVLILAAGTYQPRWLVPTRDDTSLEEILTLTPDEAAVIIAEISPTNQMETWWVPLDGGPRERLFGSGVSARKRLVLHAGTAVWSDCAERMTLARAEPDGAGGVRMTDLARNAWHDALPVAVPGTRDVLFVSQRTGDARVWRTGIDGTGSAVSVPFADLSPDLLGLSHDGAQLTVVTSDGLFVGPVDGSSPPHQVLPADDGEQRSSFSRDGARLFVDAQRADRRSIVEVPVAGGATREVVGPTAFAPAHSPTEDVLAYLALPPGVDPAKVTGPTDYVPMLLDLRRGTRRQLARATRPYPWTDLRWSADGARLLVSRRDGDTLELEVATDQVRWRFGVGSDQLFGITYVGDQVLVGRIAWSGDLWSARLR
ncbi:MAG: protein kinase [Kofleriaceae bacterium]|nr:protein kinase [Kofleriaceae bacterium]